MDYTEKKYQIDLLHEKITSHGKLSDEDRKKINYKFRLDWNYYSNSMEGNTLTMDETRSVMVGNLTVGGKPIKDVLEMKGHDEVVKEILSIGKGEARISESRIRKIHSGIMHEEDEFQKKKIGAWKTEPNYIYNYNKERFDFVLPEEVPERMHKLLNKTNAAIDAFERKMKDAPHPIDVALQFHLDYVLIHPFYDGNGRTARILTNLILISFGYPPFWVKTNERDIYNQYIGDIQCYGGNPDLFFDFCADKILRSQGLILNVLEGKDISEQNDLDKELALLKAQLSSDNVLSLSASSENICDAMEQNIIPLFILLEDKCSDLKEFFFDTNRVMNFEMEGGHSRRSLGAKESTWENMKQNWLTNQVRAKNEKIKQFNYSYELKGFKKDISARSFWFNIDVYFNEYNYSIQTSNNRQQPPHFPYGKQISSEELQSIIFPIIKDVIEGIKRI